MRKITIELLCKKLYMDVVGSRFYMHKNVHMKNGRSFWLFSQLSFDAAVGSDAYRANKMKKITEKLEPTTIGFILYSNNVEHCNRQIQTRDLCSFNSSIVVRNNVACEIRTWNYSKKLFLFIRHHYGFYFCWLEEYSFLFLVRFRFVLGVLQVKCKEKRPLEIYQEIKQDNIAL